METSSPDFCLYDRTNQVFFFFFFFPGCTRHVILYLTVLRHVVCIRGERLLDF